MVSIAACDDDHRAGERLLQLLREYEQERPESSLRVDSFASPLELLAAAQGRGGYDVYLLDILMPGRDGFSLARELRELPRHGPVVYFSVSNDYAAESYEAGAFYYLLKPLDRERLFPVLDRALRQVQESGESVFVVHTRTGPRRVSFDELLYAERAGRVMRLHCVHEKVDSLTLRVSFREAAAPLLADGRFFQCGASYVLNLRHVVGIEGQNAVIADGSRLPLPRSCFRAFRSAWSELWLR